MIQVLVNNYVRSGFLELERRISADGVLSGDPVREQGKQDREKEVKQGQI